MGSSPPRRDGGARRAIPALPARLVKFRTLRADIPPGKPDPRVSGSGGDTAQRLGGTDDGDSVEELEIEKMGVARDNEIGVDRQCRRQHHVIGGVACNVAPMIAGTAMVAIAA